MNKLLESRIISSSHGAEGFNISASDEKLCGEQLLKVLPKDWKVSFNWLQIAFFDVAYAITKEKKLIEVNYNQNLLYWWKELFAEIKQKLEKLGIKR